MPAAKPAKSLAAPTVTLKHLAASLAEGHEVPKKQAEAMLTHLVGLVVKNLKKGNRIRIVGLSILQVGKPAARMGPNPATGATLKFNPRTKDPSPARNELT